MAWPVCMTALADYAQSAGLKYPAVSSSAKVDGCKALLFVLQEPPHASALWQHPRLAKTIALCLQYHETVQRRIASVRWKLLAAQLRERVLGELTRVKGGPKIKQLFQKRGIPFAER